MGSLGIGTTGDRYVPVQTEGLSNVTAIAAGFYFSLAVKGDGTVWATGFNAFGQIGDGTTTNRSSPVQVSGLSNVAVVAAGEEHSVALKNDGTVWTWGHNDKGELGDGTTTDRHALVQVSGLSNVVAIAAGGFHSLALKRDGTVWAWGDNTSGALGDGTTTNRTMPVQVSGLANAASIAAGFHYSVAAKTDGTVWSWGANSAGQLGDGTIAQRLTPVQSIGVTAARAVAASGGTTFVLAKDDDPDFDLDGSHDLIWQNVVTGDAVDWLMHGPTWTGIYQYLVQGQGPQWQLVGSADAQRRRNARPHLAEHADRRCLLLADAGNQGPAGGYIYRGVPVEWKIVGLADLNHDHSTDLIWWNSLTGDVVYWPMNGATWTGVYQYIETAVPLDWKIVGTADLANTAIPAFSGRTALRAMWFTGS